MGMNICGRGNTLGAALCPFYLCFYGDSSGYVSAKVRRNLPDNPEGQQTELQPAAVLCAYTLNPSLFGSVCVSMGKKTTQVEIHFHLYGHGWAASE